MSSQQSAPVAAHEHPHGPLTALPARPGRHHTAETSGRKPLLRTPQAVPRTQRGASGTGGQAAGRPRSVSRTWPGPCPPPLPPPHRSSHPRCSLNAHFLVVTIERIFQMGAAGRRLRQPEPHQPRAPGWRPRAGRDGAHPPRRGSSPWTPSSPFPRTNWTRRVPHPVLIGHAARVSGRGRCAARVSARARTRLSLGGSLP